MSFGNVKLKVGGVLRNVEMSAPSYNTKDFTDSILHKFVSQGWGKTVYLILGSNIAYIEVTRD